MTPLQEKKYNQDRDQAYLNQANTVWGGSAKDFGENYKKLNESGLYNGTSFQKKYYPEQYAKFILTLKTK